MSGAYASGAAEVPSRGPAARPATPHHCPFCGDEDLRPAEEDAQAWACRSCARVFTVGLVRIDQALIPAYSTPSAEQPTSTRDQEGVS